MKLKAIDTGIIQEFPEEQGQKILSLYGGGGYVLVESKDNTMSLSNIDGMTKELLSKLNKKGISTLTHFISMCDKDIEDFNISVDMIENAKLLIKK